MKTKKCLVCEKSRRTHLFGTCGSQKDGRQSICNKCHQENDLRKGELIQEDRRDYYKKHYAENRQCRKAQLGKISKEKQDITASISTKSGRWSPEEDLVIQDTNLNAYQQAIQLGRTYSSVSNRRSVLRKKASQNA